MVVAKNSESAHTIHQNSFSFVTCLVGSNLVDRVGSTHKASSCSSLKKWHVFLLDVYSPERFRVAFGRKFFAFRVSGAIGQRHTS